MKRLICAGLLLAGLLPFSQAAAQPRSFAPLETLPPTATGVVLLQAAELADQGAYAQATALISQALSQTESPHARIALWLRLAQYQQTLQQEQAELEALAEALKIAEGAALAYESALIQTRLAETYTRIGRYDSALAAGQQAQARYQQLKTAKGYTENGLARVLLLLARIYVAKGDFAQAIRYGQQSLGAMDHANDKAFLGEQLMVMGDIYFLNGGFVSKRAYLEMALQQARLGQARAQQIVALGKLSELYNLWGKSEQGLIFLQEALALAEGSDTSQARELTLQRAELQLQLAQPDPARQDFGRVRSELTAEPDHFARARTLLRLAEGMRGLGETQVARQDYQAALQAFENLDLPYHAAQALYGLGELARAEEQMATALDFYQAVLKLAAGFKYDVRAPFYYGGLGQTQLALGQTTLAIATLETAAARAQSLYNSVGESAQLEYFEKLAPVYQALIRAYYQAGRIDDALKTLEESRNLNLLEQLQRSESERQGDSPRSEEDWTLGLPPGAMALVYVDPEAESMLQFRIRPNTDEISSQWQDRLQEGLSLSSQQLLAESQVYRQHAASLGLSDDGTPILPRLCRVYRQLLSNPQSDPHLLKELSQLLYSVLITPHESALAGISRLLIVPEAELALVPFETLIDPQGRYLVERFDIQYIQSVKILAELRNRRYDTKRSPMLVIGDPIYQPLEYERELLETNQQLLELKKQVWQYPMSHMREAYAALYSPQWEPLPGSRSEINSIQAAIPAARVLAGEEADESHFKQWADAGQLADYRVLHFATHGMAVPEIPELSALVLSQFSERSSEDGYLRMPEIANLKLAADFVNLSACETGLGKLFKGEGVVGLAQSFLTAGANQVAVSLWQINDNSTSTFMADLYRQSDQNYGRAMTAIKRRFLSGQFGENYRHPYYWSPFVVYGRLD